MGHVNYEIIIMLCYNRRQTQQLKIRTEQQAATQVSNCTIEHKGLWHAGLFIHFLFKMPWSEISYHPEIFSRLI